MGHEQTFPSEGRGFCLAGEGGEKRGGAVVRVVSRGERAGAGGAYGLAALLGGVRGGIDGVRGERISGVGAGVEMKKQARCRRLREEGGRCGA